MTVTQETTGTPVPQEMTAAGKRELNSLRDSYIGRLPATQSSATVTYAWRELWSKISRYLNRDELKGVGEAFVFAAGAHGEQMRMGGEPYIIHPVFAASILADMKLDVATLQAALLHDVLEDTECTAEQMRERFGEVVTTLVDGVTKLGKLPFKTFEDYQAENLRKMFLVMAKDIRVVLIKLADRTHNMRSLGAMRRDKQIRTAKETLEIYAPLAHRLGIYQMKRTLEDLAFKYYDPEMYYEIKSKVKKRLPEREAVVEQALEILQARLDEMGIKNSIKGRAKHFYSIYEKMNRKKLSIDQLYDLLALRVIVEDVAQCYSVLGVVHTIWKPIPGQFDDYIANPKNNMYQSLHTTVLGPSGEPLEVQIRTWAMHWRAEYGVAAHWRYKEGDSHVDDLDSKLEWIRRALEGSDETNSEEFMERLKGDVLTSDVFVFTPEGDVKNLPRGSTVVDFAFSVHTQVGEQYVGAMVNNRIVSADYELHNGDIVKIMTSSSAKPSRDWLRFVKSSKAKSKIRAYFKRLDSLAREDDVSRGKELLERELRARLGDAFTSLEALSTSMNRVARDLGLSNYDDLYFALGSGKLNTSQTAGRIAEAANHSEAEEQPSATEGPHKLRNKSDSDIVVGGTGGIQISLAQCCCPVPGDDIVGFVTKIRGIMVHRSDCERIADVVDERRVRVAWGDTSRKQYQAQIVIDAVDRSGLFADVARVCANSEANINSVRATQIGVAAGHARMKMEVMVRDVEHLYSLIAKLGGVRNVIDVKRG